MTSNIVFNKVKAILDWTRACRKGFPIAIHRANKQRVAIFLHAQACIDKIIPFSIFILLVI